MSAEPFHSPPYTFVEQTFHASSQNIPANTSLSFATICFVCSIPSPTCADKNKNAVMQSTCLSRCYGRFGHGIGEEIRKPFFSVCQRTDQCFLLEKGSGLAYSHPNDRTVLAMARGRSQLTQHPLESLSNSLKAPLIMHCSAVSIEKAQAFRTSSSILDFEQDGNSWSFRPGEAIRADGITSN
ncbi:hypothetical protein NPIL_348371 [Nephila pilipes]|uniref:Uncharacterized protein n=1 Tax=Nephila pilipes TaxID=299642 RepID=A0A8X6TTF3_NEPPI|nr:hypothetical protein NPIL_348371 [Nephila pilipes]